MKNDIILAGVGGQGILSIAATIGTAALQKKLYMKQSEVHGMSQRGGAVESHLRISDKPIASDLIPKGQAGLILSVEPMEALRYLPYLAPDGWLVTNSKPFVNITDYPEYQDLMAEIQKVENHIIIDAGQVAINAGNKLASNIVILGAASPYIELDFEAFENSIREIFARKGDRIIQANLDALNAGREISVEKA